MDDDIRRLLLSIGDRIDAQVPRLDAIEGQLKRLDRIEGRLDRIEGLVSTQGEQLRTLSDAVVLVAGIQADTSKTLGDLAQQVATMNERLARMVEGSVRGRTSDAQRHAELEARVAELRALAAGQGR
jgi:uncharacterized coiled-coil protein SlyX